MYSKANAAILVLSFILVVDIHHCSAWFWFPVDCRVTPWSPWSSCSVSACEQQGERSRLRSITTNSSGGGKPCPSLQQSLPCKGSTAQDCKLSLWFGWSSCSASKCGTPGSQVRRRFITTQQGCGGKTCATNLEQSQPCYGSTAEDCLLSSWSEWSACPAIRCGSSAMQTNTRHRIITEKCGGKQCPLKFRQTRMCFRGPVNCELSSWSEWNTCNGTVCTAGHGAQVSFRHKTIKETCGGTCTPTLRKTRNCFNSITRKAVECQLSPWSEWGDCKRTSCQLSGIQTRTRKRTVKEECPGTCKYALHQTKLCTQSQLPCFNGGTYKSNITGCICMLDYSGVCCEKSSQGSDGKTPLGFTLKIIFGCTALAVVIGLVVMLVYFFYKKNKRRRETAPAPQRRQAFTVTYHS